MTPRVSHLRNLAIALLCLLAVAGSPGCERASVEQVETSAAVPVVIEVAKIDTLQGTIAATGVVSVAPGAEMTIVAPAPGRIAEINGSEGDAVRAGAVLVRFDIPTLAADVAARRAAVTQAAARVEAARAAFSRLSSLLAQGVAAPRDVEDAKRAQAEAEADVEQARSAADAAVAIEERGVVRAAFSGVIAKRFHNVGDLVDAAASDPIMRVIDPSRLQVIATVAVSDLSRVVVGHAAEIREAGTDSTEPATVLAKSPQIDPGSAVAEVRLAFRKPTTLAAGSAVQVEIVGEERRDALLVPAAALVTEDDELFVMVAGSDNKAHKYPVAVGLVAKGLAHVTTGIKAGDRVIVRGQEGLPEGSDVTVEAR
ncbi:MAG: efflux RND transporter periplasmic adaptor subunit [Acidobacteriota bacterium]